MDKETIEKFDLRQFVKSWLLPLAAEIAILLVIFNFVIITKSKMTARAARPINMFTPPYF